MASTKKRYIVWNVFESMPAWPDNYRTVAEALEAAISKKECFAQQGFYSVGFGSDRLRVPYAALRSGVLWEGIDADVREALSFMVVDESNKAQGGFVKRGSE